MLPLLSITLTLSLPPLPGCLLLPTCLPAVRAPPTPPLPCPCPCPSPCVTVLQLLPPEVERVSLPRVLTSIAGLLRSRLHSSRDAAREVLGQVSLELGPEYLPHVLQ